MKHGDFTELAKYYVDRPGYSLVALECLKNHVFNSVGAGRVADIGAGTGKLTENLAEIGLDGYAVEPNDAMRAEGEKAFAGRDEFVWSKGSAEETGLPDSSVNWALMGSSFHWTNSELATREFYRILVPGGFFTAIWNPRDIESSELHQRIEAVVYSEIPNMKRVSSGNTVTMAEMKEKILGGGILRT
jgi:ubiquinone/menaquinone biosynthesis C-methylase UbiE